MQVFVARCLENTRLECLSPCATLVNPQQSVTCFEPSSSYFGTLRHKSEAKYFQWQKFCVLTLTITLGYNMYFDVIGQLFR